MDIVNLMSRVSEVPQEENDFKEMGQELFDGKGGKSEHKILFTSGGEIAPSTLTEVESNDVLHDSSHNLDNDSEDLMELDSLKPMALLDENNSDGNLRGWKDFFNIGDSTSTNIEEVSINFESFAGCDDKTEEENSSFLVKEEIQSLDDVKSFAPSFISKFGVIENCDGNFENEKISLNPAETISIKDSKSEFASNAEYMGNNDRYLLHKINNLEKENIEKTFEITHLKSDIKKCFQFIDNIEKRLNEELYHSKKCKNCLQIVLSKPASLTDHNNSFYENFNLNVHKNIPNHSNASVAKDCTERVLKLSVNNSRLKVTDYFDWNFCNSNDLIFSFNKCRFSGHIDEIFLGYVLYQPKAYDSIYKWLKILKFSLEEFKKKDIVNKKLLKLFVKELLEIFNSKVSINLDGKMLIDLKDNQKFKNEVSDEYCANLNCVQHLSAITEDAALTE
ncbi:hypothetical protein HK099_000520 [Clydaea vesicula]|uniref:Uncharacterized protein n=1 Tax=Clydaea vesicula TaxID=447962 RepID=A0AAD5U5L6_9FUNG|nr:hypothetical protein HK099_000520 [Clydaea vesicula]